MTMTIVSSVKTAVKFPGVETCLFTAIYSYLQLIFC